MNGSTDSSENDNPALAIYNRARNALERGDLEEAEELFRKAGELFEHAGNDEVSGVYGQLGTVAYHRGYLDAAEKWYRKALEIEERNGDEYKAAQSYQYLGVVLLEREEFEAAEKLLRKSLHINEKQGDQAGASDSCYQLGVIAHRQGDLGTAEQWFRKTLEINEGNGDEHGVGIACHCLGTVVFEAREDYESAERWLWKSLHISEKRGYEIGAAKSYHYLGFVASNREDFDAAEKWYFKSLEIKEKINDEIGVAGVCYSLSQNARDQHNTAVAEEWLQKALQIYERKGDANSALEQGKIAEHRRAFGDAEKLYGTALEIVKKQEDDQLGNDQQEAFVYRYLASLAVEQCDFETARKWYEKALVIHEKRGDMHHANMCCNGLGNICLVKVDGQRGFGSAGKWFRKSLEFDDGATWWDWVRLYAWLWRFRFLGYSGGAWIEAAECET